MEADTLLTACDELPASCGDSVMQPGELCFRLDAALDAADAGTIGAVRVRAADLDRDGATDLFAVFMGPYQAHTLVVYWNQGDGSFAAPVTLGMWGRWDSEPMAADLDGDSQLDIAVLSGDGDDAELSVFYADGDRSFDHRAFAMPNPPTDERNDVFVADLDGDERLDVLCNGVVAFIAQGDRDFAPGENLAIAGEAVQGTSGIADVDNDGTDDFVGNLGSGSDVRTFLVSDVGNGLQSEPLEIVDAAKYWAVIGDWDGDAAKELVGVRHFPGPESEAVFEMRLWDVKDGGYAAPSAAIELTPLRRNRGVRPVAMTIADLDLDSHADLLFAAVMDDVGAGCEVPRAWRAVRIVRGTDNGGVDEPACYPAVSGRPRDLVAADLNGDGVLDIAVASSAGVEVLSSDP